MYLLFYFKSKAYNRQAIDNHAHIVTLKNRERAGLVSMHAFLRGSVMLLYIHGQGGGGHGRGARTDVGGGYPASF